MGLNLEVLSYPVTYNYERFSLLNLGALKIEGGDFLTFLASEFCPRGIDGSILRFWR